MNILVRRLSRKTTEEVLHKLFAPFGEIKELNIVLDEKNGKSKGFGFVEMPDNKAAKEAIKRLNNTLLDGERIRVKITKKIKKD